MLWGGGLGMVGHCNAAVAARDPPVDLHLWKWWGRLCHEGGRCSSAFPGPCSTSPGFKDRQESWSMVSGCRPGLIVLDEIPRLTVVNSLPWKSI